MVYFVCDLLALGLAGAGCLSFCLAVESAIPDYRYHTARRVWPAKRDSFVASSVIARPKGDLKTWREASPLDDRYLPGKHLQSVVFAGFLGAFPAPDNILSTGCEQWKSLWKSQ